MSFSIPPVGPASGPPLVDGATSIAHRIAALHQHLALEAYGQEDSLEKRRKLAAIRRQLDRLAPPKKVEPIGLPEHILDTFA